jgi:methanogenic corrinoid protein MtbC1
MHQGIATLHPYIAAACKFYPDLVASSTCMQRNIIEMVNIEGNA